MASTCRVISGIEPIRQIVAARHGTMVVLLSAYSPEDLPADAADCGAAGYVREEDRAPSVNVDFWARRPLAGPGR